MSETKLIERLEFDIKFLLWRAEVHSLPAIEIHHRYEEISQHYLKLSDAQIEAVVKAILAGWGAEIKRVSSQNQKRA